MRLYINPEGAKLLFWGALLILIGLIQGAIIPAFLNPKMALSGHLAAVQSGMLLMVLGLVWSVIRLRSVWLNLAYWSSIASMYLIWVSITLSAILGASKALPMAGQGFSAHYVIEMIILAAVYIGAGLGILSGALIVIGLYDAAKASKGTEQAVESVY